MHEPKWGNIVEIYADEGFSAKNTKRPAYQKLMTDVRRKKINLILVSDLSRLSRNIMDFCLLLEELRTHSAKFLSIKEQFDTSTATGEMMVFNMINLAQFERKQTSERVTMNFHARALRGLTNGAPVVLGYKKIPDKPGSLVINELEASQVRRIFEIFLEEGSLSKTLIKIREEEIKPRICKNKGHFKAGRGIWTPSTLLNVLRNPSYVGRRAVNIKHRYKDQSMLKSYEKYQVVKASWPGIVEDLIFEEVQHELDKNRTRRACGPKSRNYFLTGILKCPECRMGFCGASAHGRGGLNRYYIHREKEGKSMCKIKRIRAGKTEDLILSVLSKIILKLGYFEIVRANLDALIDKRLASLRPEELRVRGQLLQVDREISHTLSLKETEKSDFSVGDVILGHLQKLKKERVNLQETLDKIGEQVASAKNLNVNWQDSKELANRFSSGWKKLRPFQQRRLLERVFKEIFIGKDGFSVVCWSSFKGKEVLSGATQSQLVQ